MQGSSRPVVLVSLFVLASAAFAGSPSYAPVDLVELGPSQSGVWAMNNHGAVVGFSGGEGWVHSGGVLSQLADVVDPPPAAPLRAFGIDDDGRICGDFSPAGLQRGFVLSGSSLQQLDPATTPADFSSANSLTESGPIVGSSFSEPGEGGGGSQATVWENGIPRNLGILPGYSHSVAYSINAAGRIIGSSWTCNFPFEPTCEGRATLWQGLSMTDLGPFPGFDNSYARDINDAGAIAGHGQATDLSLQHGFLRTPSGSFVDLGELPGLPYIEPRALNNSGQIVGEARAAESVPNTETVAFLWQDGQIYDLHDLIPADSGWRLLRAVDINDDGQIAVLALVEGEFARHALRLDPTNGTPGDPVPLSSPVHLAIMALLLVGTAVFVFRRLWLV